MKTLSLYSIAATLLTNNIMAQNTTISTTTAAIQQETAFQKNPSINPPENTISLHDVNPKIIKDFAKVSAAATEVKWYIENACTVAFFKTNDGTSRRYYDTKGNFICNILYCEDRYLPAAVSILVKNTYSRGYQIISAQEIQTAEKTFYFVFVENKSTWKKLLVYDNEMEIVQECFN